ncbi:MAG TPA: hypothetical protein VJ438_01660 [Candidatus Nanoarchaeia archaeon]|nr:hypothetical protein [Candidatus Nanoarchaeia archaeon]
MTQEQPLIINDIDFIETCGKGKCPYRTMYEASVTRDSIGNFHNSDILFEKCRQCAGFGFYFDKEKGKDIECLEYPKILEARNFVRKQVYATATSSAAGD